MKHYPFEYFEFVQCPECEGWGTIEYEETQGGVNANGPWVDIIGYEKTCHLCEGEGRIENTSWDDTSEGNPRGRVMKHNTYEEITK